MDRFNSSLEKATERISEFGDRNRKLIISPKRQIYGKYGPKKQSEKFKCSLIAAAKGRERKKEEGEGEMMGQRKGGMKQNLSCEKMMAENFSELRTEQSSEATKFQAS